MERQSDLWHGISGRQNHAAAILWVVFFCYAVSAALIFQKLLLPLISSLHAGSGLLSNDAAYFDSAASMLAEQIRLYGWDRWQLYPAASASGNVAILAALYAVFGHDPTLIIPVNAAVHALGGVLVFLLAHELSGRKPIGSYAGVIAASLFIVFPSALNWYGQIHKDGYAIAGTLLILWTWVKAAHGQINPRGWLMLLLAHFAGIVLVGIVRPYNLKLLLIVTLIAWLAIVAAAMARRRLGREMKLIAFLSATTITLAGGISAASVMAPQMEDTYAHWQGNGQWQWKDAPWLPNGIEGYIELAAKTRAGLIDYGLSENAKSMIDPGIAPQSVGEVAAYLPRALQVSLLAPFPTSWLANISMTRLVAAAEMLVYYLCLPGVLLLLIFSRTRGIWLSMYFAGFFLLVQGFTIANLGTLYRLRYAYLFIFMMLGILGWLTWLDRTGRLKRWADWMRPSAHLTPPASTSGSGAYPARKEALGNGLLVMALTFLCFVGFFIRDILMAHAFGLGSDLDNFFIALMAPMFLVSVLCMPLGAAFIPTFLEIKEQVSQRAASLLVASTSFWMTACLMLVCLALYLFGPSLIPLLYSEGAAQNKDQLVLLLDIALPILLFSGAVILGNAVLNANGRGVLTSLAQLIVPVVAVFALLLFGDSYGIQSVMYGMVAGQLLNLLIVQYCLRQQGVSLWPGPDFSGVIKGSREGLASLLAQYWPLVASAFFVSVTAAVSTMLAMSLPEGAVSAFNLGNKVTLFVTGLVGAAVSAIMLPYFSAMVSKNHLVAARRELSLFLLFATFISVPISTALFVWSEPIVRLAFEGGIFDSNATSLVTRVMQYAVVQLPFFVCNSLLLKFAIATKHVFSVGVVAVIGLLVNVAASLVLMGHMGVAGIALGATVSMLASTVLLVFVLVRYGHITWFDAVVMLINWLLYITLLICVHFESIPSIFMSIMAYAVLLAGYFNSLSRKESSGVGIYS